MAENEKCISRIVALTDYREAFVDHHEWRFLDEGAVLGGSGYRFYYCIFCLEVTARVMKDESALKHR